MSEIPDHQAIWVRLSVDEWAMVRAALNIAGRINGESRPNAGGLKEEFTRLDRKMEAQIFDSLRSPLSDGELLQP